MFKILIIIIIWVLFIFSLNNETRHKCFQSIDRFQAILFRTLLQVPPTSCLFKMFRKIYVLVPALILLHNRVSAKILKLCRLFSKSKKSFFLYFAHNNNINVIKCSHIDQNDLLDSLQLEYFIYLFCSSNWWMIRWSIAEWSYSWFCNNAIHFVVIRCGWTQQITVLNKRFSQRSRNFHGWRCGAINKQRK